MYNGQFHTYCINMYGIVYQNAIGYWQSKVESLFQKLNCIYIPKGLAKEHHFSLKIAIIVKPVLSGHSKQTPKIGFQDRLSLNYQKYCRMLHLEHSAILLTSLSYHLSLRPLFCLFLSDHLRQVLLYIFVCC